MPGITEYHGQYHGIMPGITEYHGQYHGIMPGITEYHGVVSRVSRLSIMASCQVLQVLWPVSQSIMVFFKAKKGEEWII